MNKNPIRAILCVFWSRKTIRRLPVLPGKAWKPGIMQDVSADGEQARAMAGELDFDLVVLDLNLPRLDGVSILRSLRTRKPSMPILVLTGRTKVEDRGVESILTVDDLKLDRVERRVERAGRRIELTSKEFALLEYLMRNAGRRITRTMIIEHVWNLTFDSTTNVVDVYINYLRRKVDDGFSPALIHTVRGVGYQLSPEGVAA